MSDVLPDATVTRLRDGGLTIGPASGGLEEARMSVVLVLVALLCVGCVGLFLWSIVQAALERGRDQRQRLDFQAERRRTLLAQIATATHGVADHGAQELEAELTITVVRAGSLPTEPGDLAVVAKPLTPRLVACLTLASAPLLPGLPLAVRARLASHDDATLFEKALARTLPGAPPIAGADRLTGPSAMEWLVGGADILGSAPLILASCGDEVRWIEARPLGDARALANLLADAHAGGRFKGTVLFWDGARLHDVGVMQHTIMGPTTPDWTLVHVPPAMQACMKQASARIEVWAPRERAVDRAS